MYRVEVDWAPAYELWASLVALVDRPLRGTTALGRGWATRVRSTLPPEFTDAAAGIPDLEPWIRRCPGARDAAGFLAWLARMPAARPWLPALRSWHEAYFRDLDPAIGAGLALEAGRRRRSPLPPQELVESATAGVWLEPSPAVDTVVLVPQHHARPWNLHTLHDGVLWFLYPAEVLPPAPGEPEPDLVRALHALADGSRLRILRFLAGGTRSFSDLVRESGLAKSTVHHHMVILRAAGLVRVHTRGEGPDRYSLRPGALRAVGGRLAAFGGRDEA